MEEKGRNPDPTDTANECQECGQPFRTVQGLAGHRRLAHSARTRSELEAKQAELAQRETAAKRREAEAARQAEVARTREAEANRREREIAETGPAALGMVTCPECGSWFEDSRNLSRHQRTIHPIEEAVADEVGCSRGRVEEVWREAVAKGKRHPDATDDQIIERFWFSEDQKVLRSLLAKNATFRPGEG